MTYTANEPNTRTEWGVERTWPDGHVEYRRVDSREEAERQTRLANDPATRRSPASTRVVTRTVTATRWTPSDPNAINYRSDAEASHDQIHTWAADLAWVLSVYDKTLGTAPGLIRSIAAELTSEARGKRLRNEVYHVDGGDLYQREDGTYVIEVTHPAGLWTATAAITDGRVVSHCDHDLTTKT